MEVNKPQIEVPRVKLGSQGLEEYDSWAGLVFNDSKAQEHVQEQLKVWTNIEPNELQEEKTEAETTKPTGLFDDEINKEKIEGKKNLEEEASKTREVRLCKKPSWLNNFELGANC